MIVRAQRHLRSSQMTLTDHQRCNSMPVASMPRAAIDFNKPEHGHHKVSVRREGEMLEWLYSN